MDTDIKISVGRQEFQRLGFRFMPKNALWKPQRPRWPPLLHALDQGFFLLAAFLLANGATLDQRAEEVATVFDVALSPFIVTQGIARFFFNRNGDYIKPDGTTSRLSPALLPPFFFEHLRGQNVLLLLASKWFRPDLKFWSSDVRTEHLGIKPYIFPSLPLRQGDSIVTLRSIVSLPVKLILLILSMHINGLLFNYGPRRSWSRIKADELPVSLPKIWADMLVSFPNALADSGSLSGVNNCSSLSLLAKLISHARIHDWASECWAWPIGRGYASSATSDSEQSEAIIFQTIEHLIMKGCKHEPSLRDLLFWNAYSLAPKSSRVTEGLKDLKFRRPAMNFDESRLLVWFFFARHFFRMCICMEGR